MREIVGQSQSCSSSVVVRKADLRFDREPLLRFWRETLPARPDTTRFEWLYLNNPFGTAQTLIAAGGNSDEIVGTASAFPRQLWIKGRQQQAWILGDFCMSERFRSLGPAVILQRACMASIPQTHVWYDFPSATMMAVYGRLGVGLFSSQVRYVKLLRINTRSDTLGKYFAKTLSSLTHFTCRQSTRRSRCTECYVHEGEFGAEFTDLDMDSNTHNLVRGVRSAEYLNWRYLRNPTAEYKVIAARCRGRLVGYVVISIDNEECTVTDVLAVEADDTVPALFRYLIRMLLNTNTNTLRAALLPRCSLMPHFWRAGFIPRETLPGVIVGAEKIAMAEISRPQSWLLLDGDRES